MTRSDTPVPPAFWAITMLTAVVLAATSALGVWQLSRAAQKQALQSAQDARAQLPALVGDDLVREGQDGTTETASTLLHRQVNLRGVWLAEHTVYLDNRQMRGQPGFYVLTPLQLRDAQGVVLVQRGWIARNFQDRTALLKPLTPEGEIQLQGRVMLSPPRLYELGDSGQGSSRIRQNLDLGAFRTESGLALATHMVLQTGVASEGLQRDWPVVSTGVEKHYGYAFQWFGLSGLIAILYVWFQIVRRFIRPSSRSAT